MVLWVLAWVVVTTSTICVYGDSIGRALRIIDHPDGARKSHAGPTPLIGGIAVMLPATAFAIFKSGATDAATPALLSLAIAGGGSLLIGYVDDRQTLAVSKRLLSSVLLAIAALLITPTMMLHTLTFSAWIQISLAFLALPFTLLCLVGLQNAVNMADGKNGLMISMAAMWTLCLILYADMSMQVYLQALLLGLLVALPFNLRGELFLGDSGTYSLGMVLGLAAIHVYNTAQGAWPLAAAIALLAIPVVDCLRLVVVRRRAGRAPWMPDADHFHHRLCARWSWPGGVIVYLMIAAAPALAASLLPDYAWGFLALSLGGYGAALRLTRPVPTAMPEPAPVRQQRWTLKNQDLGPADRAPEPR